VTFQLCTDRDISTWLQQQRRFARPELRPLRLKLIVGLRLILSAFLLDPLRAAFRAAFPRDVEFRYAVRYVNEGQGGERTMIGNCISILVLRSELSSIMFGLLNDFMRTRLAC
jgi:hypothetical protein